jgi:hypothetical protein
MSTAPVEESKPVFTPGQKLALSRVYGFLMELGRQRLNRLKSNGADVPLFLKEQEEVVIDETVTTEKETTPRT